MINFKDPKDQVPSALFVAGVVLIIGSVVALFIHKSQDQKALVRKYREDVAKLETRSKEAKKNSADYKTLVGNYRWNDKEDVVTPSALTLISKGTEANRLRLVSFRPQKSIENDALIQLPMQFTVDGSFANVANLIESLQKSKSKLAVQQVQIASQEGETDLVSATISLYAFVAKTPKKESANTASPTPVKTSGAKNNG